MTRKGCGIRIKNPLSLPAWVIKKGGPGLLSGVSITRTIKPGASVYIPVPHPGDYDIEVSIFRYDEVGNSKVLGAGGWQPTAVAPKARPEKPSKEPEAPLLRSLGEMIEQMRKREEAPV